jgi:NRPS condensation-like uncharacterized protein
MKNIKELHKELPDTLPVEVSDKLQFFLRANADQQMRYVIIFNQQINFDLLKIALRLTVYAETIFSYVYKEDGKNVYWLKEETIEESSLIDLIEVNGDLENYINQFLNLDITPFAFPLVRARVLRNEGKDVLCINMNHTPTDGSGLKMFVKKLAEIYSNLIINPSYLPKNGINSDRSIKQVTDNFTFSQKLKFVKLGFKSPKRTPSWSFDFNKSDINNQKQFIKSKINSDIFDKIKTFSKLNNATINDVVLTAFIRTFSKLNKKNEVVAKPILIPMDLRKYINPNHNTAICSLTSSLICNIGSDIGNSFSDTLAKVQEVMNKKKEDHSEMNILFQAIVLSKFMAYNKLKEQFLARKMPPIPLVTNVGIINPSDINFDGIPIEQAYITGAISLKDYFCMGYSTFNKEITFSIGFIGSDLQNKKIEEFLENLKFELTNF